MPGTVQSVETHYDAFPYPTVTSLALPLPSGFKRWTLDWLLRRRTSERLPADPKVWVAGCGQQQGARGPFGGAAHWQLLAYAEPLLRAFDGRRPAGEVVARFSDEFGAEALQALLLQLMPHDLGLLAPAG